jgi:predicted GIY-YIG superfamily endonuclease
MTTYLYRLWDDADRLLYVGISKSAIHRLHEHLTEQPWADQIVKQTVERHATRQAALAAEKYAIQTEGPLHNIVHSLDAVPVWDVASFGPTPPRGRFDDTRQFVAGTFVAVGLTDGTCVVGQVIVNVEPITVQVAGQSITSSGHVVLRKKNYQNGYYDGEFVVVAVDQVREFVTAEPTRRGHLWDAHLGDFESLYRSRGYFLPTELTA